MSSWWQEQTTRHTQCTTMVLLLRSLYFIWTGAQIWRKNPQERRSILLRQSLDTWCISSHLVCLNIRCMHKITNLWKFKLDWSSELWDNCERKKHPCPTKLCAFTIDFTTSNSKLEISKSNSWKIASVSKTMSVQREPFLTMFYTINLSPLRFYDKIILSNYQ